jgi:hypothetical protein
MQLIEGHLELIGGRIHPATVLRWNEENELHLAFGKDAHFSVVQA